MDSQNKTENQQKSSIPNPILIKVIEGKSKQKEFQFRKNFRIGRESDCELQLSNSMISRYHVKIFFQKDKWWLQDSDSSNGVFVDDKKVDKISIDDEIHFRLGEDGPILLASLRTEENVKSPENPGTMTQYIKHYFSEDDQEIGQHTMMIRKAYQKINKKQKSRYGKIIGTIIVICIAIAIFAYVQYKQASREAELAQNIFYSMKTLELQLAELEDIAAMNKDFQTLETIKKYRAQQAELANSYNQFLDDLNVYDSDDISSEDKIILKIAQIFGECEVGMPKDFAVEVKQYIEKWKSSPRLKKAISLAIQNNYHKLTEEIMLQYHLSPHFFYLALQESDFLPKCVGPKTRYGIAKGYWQFIPETARRYGLKTGPLVEYNRYDPRDERFNFEKATHTAAKYIRTIYNTDAQASGLLVLASYNWGEGNVLKLIRQLPENPKERNFWQLLSKYRKKIPRETYNYVFYIFSAAVICEDPALFGFDFENPLKSIAVDEST